MPPSVCVRPIRRGGGRVLWPITVDATGDEDDDDEGGSNVSGDGIFLEEFLESFIQDMFYPKCYHLLTSRSHSD